MDPLTIAALGTAAAGAFNAFSGNQAAKAAASAQKEANAANIKSSREQMQFQEYMSSTAHQRAVQDLRAAGINPLMAAGAAASTPSGAMATSSPVVDQSKSKVTQALADSVNNGFSAYSLQKDLQQKDANLRLTRAQEYAADSGRFLNEANATRISNDNVDNLLNTNARREAQAANSRALVNEAKTREAQSNLARMRAETDASFHKFDSINSRVKSGLGTVNSAFDIFKPFAGGTSDRSRSYTEEHYNAQGEHTGSRSRRYE